MDMAQQQWLRRKLRERLAEMHMRGEFVDLQTRFDRLDGICRELGITRAEALRELTSLRDEALNRLQTRGLISRRGSAVVRTPAGIRDLMARRAAQREEERKAQEGRTERLRDEIAELEFDAGLEHLDSSGRERVAHPLGLSAADGEAPLATTVLRPVSAERGSAGESHTDEDEHYRGAGADDAMGESDARGRRQADIARWRHHPGYLGSIEDERQARP